MSRKAFSLIELLVVVGIIALLIGILVPALSAARRSARSTACLSQMRQIGLATIMYAQDSHDYLPRSSHSALANGAMPWGYALLPYLGRGTYDRPSPSWDELFNGLYRCPEDPRRDRWSYGKSVWFELTSGETGEIYGVSNGPTFSKIGMVPRSSSTILYGELGSGSMADHIMAHFWYMGGSPEVDAKRHGSTSNFVFVDGHAESRVFKTTFSLPSVDLWHPGKAQ